MKTPGEIALKHALNDIKEPITSPRDWKVFAIVGWILLSGMSLAALGLFAWNSMLVSRPVRCGDYVMPSAQLAAAPRSPIILPAAPAQLTYPALSARAARIEQELRRFLQTHPIKEN